MVAFPFEFSQWIAYACRFHSLYKRETPVYGTLGYFVHLMQRLSHSRALDELLSKSHDESHQRARCPTGGGNPADLALLLVLFLYMHGKRLFDYYLWGSSSVEAWIMF